MNTIQRAIVAAGLVGVLAIAAIVIWGPRADTLPAALGGPHAVDGPATPTTWPYSQVAILRDQRMSTDVLPAAFVADNEPIVAASARHIATDGHEQMWLAVNAAQNLCIIDITDGESGGATVCVDVPSHDFAPGDAIMGGGAGDYVVQVFADGAVTRTGKYAPTGKQIAYNVWLDGVAHPDKLTGLHRSPSGAGQYSFPLAYPYSSYAILRQEALPVFKLPKFLRDQSSTSSANVIDLSTVRYAGAYRGAKTWVGLDTAGDVCLITYGAGDANATGCDVDHETGRAKPVTGFLNGFVLTQLFTDGVPSAEDVSGETKIGPNVWAGDSDFG